MSDGGTDASISRGVVNMALDELLNHQDSKKDFDKRYDLLRALQALPSGTDHRDDFLNILKTHANIKVQEADYLRDYWYNPDRPGFWPTPKYTFHPVEPIVRMGLIKAILVAEALKWPIVSYWMPVGSTFESLVIPGERQVTRIILTPPAAPEYPSELHNFAEIYVAKPARAVGKWEATEPQDYKDPNSEVVITRINKHAWTPRIVYDT
jgi:hypothetical protein